jgi:hypothetical protein
VRRDGETCSSHFTLLTPPDHIRAPNATRSAAEALQPPAFIPSLPTSAQLDLRTIGTNLLLHEEQKSGISSEAPSASLLLISHSIALPAVRVASAAR